MAAQDLTPTIGTAAGTPLQATADGQSATARGIPELIAANNYLAAAGAMSLRGRGLRMSKLRLPRQVPCRGPQGNDWSGPGSWA